MSATERANWMGERKPRPCSGCRRPRSTCWVMPCLYLEMLLQRDSGSKRGEARLAQWVRAGGALLTRKDGRHIDGNPVEREREAIAHFAAKEVDYGRMG